MSDEAENAVIAFLLQLDPATLRAIFGRFEEVLQAELDSVSARLRRIALALHQASRLLGRSPSVREYKRLRHEHPEHGWPDPRSITRWLGVRSWNDALVRMGLDAVLDGDAIEGAIGPSYGIEEVVQAVRDCAEDVGRPPTITDFLAWQRRPDVRERPGRRPGSTWVFNRLFGGFPPARVAAGMVEDAPTAAHPTQLILRTANYRLTQDQILDDIRDVAARTTGHLTATVYDHERMTIYRETKAEGRPRALAGVGTVYRHFGNWRSAIAAAGIGAERGKPRRRMLGEQISDDDLLRAIADAHRATPGRLTINRYDLWRKQQITSNPALGDQWPSPLTIRRRYDGWHAAIEAAGIEVPREMARTRTQMSSDQLLQALRDADAATSGRLTMGRYRTWREDEAARAPARLGVLPHDTTIRARFGGWKNAVKRMRESTGNQ